MRNETIAFVAMLGIGLVSCNCSFSADDKTEVVLKEDLNAKDFAQALVGRWKGVFSPPNKANIQSAEFRSDGTMTFVVGRNKTNEEISGRYRVEFESEPRPKVAVTEAKVIVEGEGRLVILSPVIFGLHNAFPAAEGPFLRIGGEPYGVLKKEVPAKPDYEQGKKIAAKFREADQLYVLLEELAHKPELFPGLVALVETGDEVANEEFRLPQWKCAARVLGEMGDKRAAPFLAARVGTKQTARPDWFFIVPMGKLGIKEIVPYLVTWLKEDRTWEPRYQAFGSHANYILVALQELTAKDFGADTSERTGLIFEKRKEIMTAIDIWWTTEGHKQFGSTKAEHE